MEMELEQQARSKFCALLIEMAQPTPENKSAYFTEQLKLLYKADTDECFRHFYSDIFAVLTQIKNNPDNGNIDILAQSVGYIRETYDQKRGCDEWSSKFSDALRKLYDHVNLDVARISYLEKNDRTISGEESIKKLKAELDSLKTEIDDLQKQNKKFQEEQSTLTEAQKAVQANLDKSRQDFDTSKTAFETSKGKIDAQLKKVTTKLSNSEKEYIAILGIFASVVVAFVGSFAFSTSVLENIANASIYRTLIVTIIIGLVFVNGLYGLFMYINKLVDKDTKEKPLWVANGVLLALILIVLLCWSCGCVEHRNLRITNSTTATQTPMSTTTATQTPMSTTTATQTPMSTTTATQTPTITPVPTR